MGLSEVTCKGSMVQIIAGYDLGPHLMRSTYLWLWQLMTKGEQFKYLKYLS